jgi:hypothetical protein
LIPSLSFWVNLLSKYIVRLGSEEGEDINNLLEQLLLTTFQLDLSDETGRKRLEILTFQAITHAPLSEINMRYCIRLSLKLKGDFGVLVESLTSVFQEINSSILQVPQEMIERVQTVCRLKILEIIHILVEYPEAVRVVKLDLQGSKCSLSI